MSDTNYTLYNSCKDCVAPQRHLGCHAECPHYQREKERRDKIREAKIKQADSDGVLATRRARFENYIKHKRRDR